ncbi:MAG: hypothetical protein Q9218_005097 [Villophora microphyllina]
MTWNIPAMYFDDGTRCVDKKLLQLAEPQNRGLKYIRQLVLDDTYEARRSPEKTYDYQDVTTLMHMLPMNTLTRFRDSKPGLVRARINSYAIQSLFQDLPSLTLCLHTLDLAGVDLAGCHTDLLVALNLSVLSKLSFRKCWHAEDFLVALVKAAGESPLNLQHFSIYHSVPWIFFLDDGGSDQDRDRFLEALGSLLDHTSKKLCELWVLLRGFDMNIDIDKITQHGPTLKWLFLDVRVRKGSWATLYSLPDWRKLCGSLEVVEHFDAAYNPAGNTYFCPYMVNFKTHIL